MDLQLIDKVALVSGSSAGIGYAIAASLAAEGATVIVNGRSQERVAAAIANIEATGAAGKLLPLVADLGTVEGVTQTAEQFPQVNILINNLGIYEPKAFDAIADEDWLHIFEVNVLSGVRLSRLYLPSMRQQNWGRIVFISSESAVNIPVEMIHYGMTKTAQVAIARGLAETTGGTGITVNSILAGPTKSEGVEKFVEQMAVEQGNDVATVEAQFFQTVRPSSLLQRFATTEEVANFVAYIASPLSSATNGAALRVEGGLVRSIF